MIPCDADDIRAEDVLSDEDLREHTRARRERALSCADGTCGGCPRCGVPLDDEGDK